MNFDDPNFDFENFLLNVLPKSDSLTFGNRGRTAGAKRRADSILESKRSSGSSLGDLACQKKAKTEGSASSSPSLSTSSSPHGNSSDDEDEDLDVTKPQRHFVFTLFGDRETQDDFMLGLLCTVSIRQDKVRYLVFQREVCPKTKRLHLQGYLELKTPMRYKAIDEMFSANMNFLKRRGTREEARDYCMKSDSRDPQPNSGPHEAGIWNKDGSGHRSDLDSLCEMLADGASQRQLYQQSPATWCRNYRALAKAESFYAPAMRDKPDILVLWGPPGVGKTKKAYEHITNNGHSLDKVYTFNLGKNWWNDYVDQPIVVFDDFNGSEDDIPFRFLLNVLDRTPIQVPTKGGSARFKANCFIFTSNRHPSEWYVGVSYNTGQLKRRIAESGRVIELKFDPKNQKKKKFDWPDETMYVSNDD